MIPSGAATSSASAPVEVAGDQRSLDDVMLAMDVVDTLRHRTRMVDLELNEAERERQLVVRLREIYGAQGIDVPDRILTDGVRALAEQRFVYKPPRNTFAVRLARLYVARRRWLPQALAGLGALFAITIGFQVLVFGPMNAEWQRLPAEITQTLTEGQELAVDSAVDLQLAGIAAEARQAIEKGDRNLAKAQLAILRDTTDILGQQYDIRIVSRQGESTGFFRQSEDNPGAVNYYLVVEAVAPGGRVLNVPVENIETGKSERVSIWAQRVQEPTFRRVQDEKLSTGLVTNDILGGKVRGELSARFDEVVPGGAITKW